MANCVAGQCGPPICQPLWMDLDPTLPGCETANSGLPTTGVVTSAVAAASSYGDKVQVTPSHRNVAVLADPTPSPTGGAVETRSDGHVNLSGFNAIQH